MSLQSATTLVLVNLVVLAILSALTLVFITTRLHQNARAMATAIESVRVAEELEIDLLTHARAGDPVVKVSLASSLRVWLGAARDYAGSAVEQDLLDRAEVAIEDYLASENEQSVGKLESAFTLLEELVLLNMEQARAAASTTARWDRAANRVGIGTGALLLVVGASTVAWLRRSYRPVHAIIEAIERFAAGDRRSRAPVTGPAELRSMATRFNALVDATERQREAQAAFLAGVAHDLRNPLSALKLATGALDRERTLLPDTVRRGVTLVRRQIDRLDRMTGDLLDAARIEAGHLELRKSPRDLNVLTSEVVELYRPTTDRHDLRVTPSDAALVVECDPLRIEQVIGNLVHNAIKYSPHGGIVDVHLDAREGEAFLSVRDQGIGMTEEELRRIFDPFERGGAARDITAGTGLGLSVARRIVEAHGGHIEVVSRPGLGSTFTIRLPLSPAR